MRAAQELSFDLNGRRVSALSWGEASQPTILALHGWLDNAASFALLADRLLGYRIIALDMAGHGCSDWRSRDSGYPIWGYVEDLHRVQLQLGLERFYLLGHSLGAGVCSLFAASWPEVVIKLGVIENLGPLADDQETFPDSLRAGIEQHQQSANAPKARPLEAWIRARVQSQFPVPEEAARLLMQRNTKSDGAQQFAYRCDPRLKLPSLIRLTEPQVRAALSRITAPVLLISGKQGLKRPLTQARIECVKNIEHLEFEGGHHLHMEPEAADSVASALEDFYAEDAG